MLHAHAHAAAYLRPDATRRASSRASASPFSSPGHRRHVVLMPIYHAIPGGHKGRTTSQYSDATTSLMSSASRLSSPSLLRLPFCTRYHSDKFSIGTSGTDHFTNVAMQTVCDAVGTLGLWAKILFFFLSDYLFIFFFILRGAYRGSCPRSISVSAYL